MKDLERRKIGREIEFLCSPYMGHTERERLLGSLELKCNRILGGIFLLSRNLSTQHPTVQALGAFSYGASLEMRALPTWPLLLHICRQCLRGRASVLVACCALGGKLLSPPPEAEENS